MRNSNGLYNDGLDLHTCQNNGQTTWTYNQGNSVPCHLCTQYVTYSRCRCHRVRPGRTLRGYWEQATSRRSGGDSGRCFLQKDPERYSQGVL